MSKVPSEILNRARLWTTDMFDGETRHKVREMIENDPDALADSFYRDLEFGTGGLRGIMGVGTNRMNRYTVGMATQGLADYLKRSFSGSKEIKVAVAHDSRINSDYFTSVTAEVLTANGIGVYVFDALRPVPLLSYAVRELGCQAGIVITASHNPVEYNGYKVYWEDGGQLVPPHDINITEMVRKTRVSDIRFGKADELISVLDSSFDDIYLERIRSLSLSPEAIERQKDLRIVFSPIHGSTVRLVPEGLRMFGFSHVFNVPEQDAVDGNFPTVKSPNPEDPAAFEMALEKARETDAELVMASDPDGDRVGAAVKDSNGDYILLNGNQVAAILTKYILGRLKEEGRLKGNEFIVKTIVTTGLLDEIAADHGVECFNVLTGFKYIAEKIRLLEGKKKFICGGEESYGFLVGDFVRDKDAVITCCMIAEAAAWAKDRGMSLYGFLTDIYREYRLYVETLMSVTRKGMKGAEEISKIMEKFRSNPPEMVDGKTLARVIDYQLGIDKDLYMGEEYIIDLPQSNVLQFILEDGSSITMRPSGTEPKIKFYFGCNTGLENISDYTNKRKELLGRIENIKKDLGLTPT